MKVTLAVLFAGLVGVAAVAQVPSLRFTNVPLSLTLEQYTELTGRKVEIVQGVSAAVTVQAEKDLTAAEFADLIEQELKKQNVGLFQIASNRFVATWIDPRLAPSPPQRPSYAERLARRRTALRQASEAPSTNAPAGDK